MKLYEDLETMQYEKDCNRLLELHKQVAFYTQAIEPGMMVGRIEYYNLLNEFQETFMRVISYKPSTNK